MSVGQRIIIEILTFLMYDLEWNNLFLFKK